MLADFVAVIPQTPSLVLFTYRPEYRGALSRVPGAQSIALAPLSDSETSALVTELLGRTPRSAGLATMIAERAAGNPFFVEEMVRELADRGVLRGNRGAYVSTADAGEVGVPATLQATIAARSTAWTRRPSAPWAPRRSSARDSARACLKRWELILPWRTCLRAS